MIDILLDGIIQSIVKPRFWLAVIGGALAAVVFVGSLIFLGLFAA